MSEKSRCTRPVTIQPRKETTNTTGMCVTSKRAGDRKRIFLNFAEFSGKQRIERIIFESTGKDYRPLSVSFDFFGEDFCFPQFLAASFKAVGVEGRVSALFGSSLPVDVGAFSLVLSRSVNITASKSLCLRTGSFSNILRKRASTSFGFFKNA